MVKKFVGIDMGKVTLHDVLEINQRIEDKLDKIESRVTILELWRASVVGKISTIVAIATLSINIGWEYIKYKFIEKG